MCVSCDGYDYSRSCGIRCADHAYEVDEELSDFASESEYGERDVWMRCGRCGCVRHIDNGDPPAPPEPLHRYREACLQWLPWLSRIRDRRG